MRRFTLGSGSDRKIVDIELSGTRMSVVQTMSDNSTRRSEKAFGSEADARSASNTMASELISRGYAESPAHGHKQADTGPSAREPASGSRERGFDDVEAPAGAAASVLQRLTPARSVRSSADGSHPKKKKPG
jgi:hypothetical protein